MIQMEDMLNIINKKCIYKKKIIYKKKKKIIKGIIKDTKISTR